MDNLMIRQKGKLDIANSCLVLIAFFYVVLFPTSFGGVIFGDIWIIRNFSALAIALYLVMKNGITREPLIITLMVMGLLLLLTLTTFIFCEGNDFRIAYASLSAFISTIIVWCITFRNGEISERFIKIFLNAFTLLMCVWGVLLVLNHTFAIDFTRTWYSQLTENMFDNMIVIRGKPVMSFGTHSMAAFFLMMVYFYNCVMIHEQKNSFLQYIFLAILLYLEVCLNSNTAILAIAVMLMLLIWAKNTMFTRIIVAIVVMVGVLYFYQTGYITEFVTDIMYGFNSEKHGFTGRYLSGIYEGNFEMISNFFGVGFLRSASDYFSMFDSGVIYILTQGNVPALIMVYWLMYNFMYRNMNKYAKLTFALFFIWEVISASTFVSVKMIFAQILTIYIINGLCEKKEQEKSAVEGSKGGEN